MEVVVVPCLYDNYSYLIVNGNEAAVVDPSEAWPVMKAAADRGLELTAALCTHHHNDHIGGIADLLDEYQNLEVYGFYQDKKRIPLITKPVEDNDRFSVCGVDVDVIVSNPPYVAAGSPDLATDVGEWEPAGALFAGDDGLDDIRLLASGAGDHLRPGGSLVLEIGADQGRAVAEILGDAGLVGIEIRPDLTGRDRVAVARRPT